LTFLLLVWYPVNIHYTGLFIHGFPVSKRLRLHLYHLNGRQMQGFKRAVELRNTLLCRFNSFVNAIDAFSQPCLDAFFPYGFRLRDEWPSPGGGRATESGNNEYNQEFWYARELQEVLEYSQWRRFHEVISKAMKACESSGYEVDDHFANVGKMIKLAKGAEREVEDFMLTRYACYLIVMNGDPRKEVIALGQTYFAVKTRQQELLSLVIMQYFRTEGIRAYMVDWELRKYIPEKVLRRTSRFLIIWGAPSWQLTFSVQHRQMRSFGVIM